MMQTESALDTIELRRLVNRLFSFMEDAGVRSIPIRQDQYWSVFHTDAFEADPPEMVVGNVLNDLEDLRGEVNGLDQGNESEAVLSVWHAFHHLAGLAQFIAYSDSQGDVEFVERAGAAA